jgi:cytochrome c biogenesis protein CcmG, thiol:disulfide interchange protein DsbE
MDATNDPQTRSVSRPWPWMLLVVVAAAIFVYLILVGGPGRRPPGTEGPAVGRRLAYFRLEPLTGESSAVTLEDFQGRVTLVNYWGTWCPPCRREFPEIVELAATYAKRPDFRLYAVSCGGSDNDEDTGALRTETEQFLASKQVSMPTYSDQNAASRRALNMALDEEGHGFSYPTTFIVDRKGVIRGLWRGYDSSATREMAELVERLLEESPEQS